MRPYPPAVTTIVFITALTVVATARYTRLVVDDTITESWRHTISKRAATSARWAWTHKLVSCTWCASIWVSVATTSGSMAWYYGQLGPGAVVWVLILAIPAVSWAASILHDWLDSPPPARQHDVSPVHIILRDERR